MQEDPRPDQSRVPLLVVRGLGSVELEVDVRLAVELGEGRHVEGVDEGARDVARRFTRVVPALERDDEQPTLSKM
ncbi:hypothetical protein GCM10025867_27880 [Frondihabitans sucicola]|uniref:Uncharacterized protein n=1 Tax=Frondihabitans sucicola TaxID=1268041 RepID=A0ABN6XZQ3_9MICO|nr:hypothetical protein GCM10025867_27880 [Frondihabitans sucicola]